LTEELEHEGKLYQLATEPSGITVEIDGKHWVCIGAKPKAKPKKKSKKGAKKE
tara:strand:- start:237 stop:395 length:159 start_codon:yes stop_codon:yes gene_type:complete